MAYFLIFLAHVLGWVAGVLVGILMYTASNMGMGSGFMVAVLFGIGTPALVAAQLTNTRRVFVSYLGFGIVVQIIGWSVLTTLSIVSAPTPPRSLIVGDLITILHLFWFVGSPLLTYSLASRSRRLAALPA